MNKELNDILNYLNQRFNQDSEEYSIFTGAKPQVIRFNETTAISIWGCGAIVCIGRLVYFIMEDDGHWFAKEYVEKDNIRRSPEFGMLSHFSLAWGESFINAFKALNDYVKKEGVAYYYSGTDVVCGYELK